MEQFATVLPNASIAYPVKKDEDAPTGSDQQTENGVNEPVPATKTSLVLKALETAYDRDISDALKPDNDYQGATSVRDITEALDKGEISPEEAAAKFRALCNSVIWSKFNKERNVSVIASSLLDSFNKIATPALELPDDEKKLTLKEAYGDAAPTNPEDPTAAAAQATAAAANGSDFFLPPSDPDVQKYLTITADADILRPPTAGPGRRVNFAAATGPGSTSTGGELSTKRRAGRPPRAEGAAGSQLGAGMKKRRPTTPSAWTKEVQGWLSTVLRDALKQTGSPGPTNDELKESLPPLMMLLLQQLRDMQVCETMKNMGATFKEVLATLQIGGYVELEDFSDALSVSAHQAAEAYIEQTNPDMRRGKITGQAESFVTLVTSCIENVLGELRVHYRQKQAAEAEAKGITELELFEQQNQEYAPVRVPPSIKHNMEPYRHGDWRQTPFACRPYVRLQEYHIVEESSKEVITRKLSTGKKGGCDGHHCKSREDLGTYSLEVDGFDTECSCLKRNTECDAHCACHTTGNCHNRAISARDTVKMGEDVQEVNSWGMDCYTRRNIQDAVLEAQVFGPYKMPTFGRGGRRPEPTAHAATAAGQHAQVAAGSPLSAPLPPLPTTRGSTRSQDVAMAEANGDAKEGEDKKKGEGATEEEQQQQEEEEPLQPPPEKLTREQLKEQKLAVERAVQEWIERKLIPSINRQGDDGWDILKGLADVKQRAEANDDALSIAAADAVEARAKEVGYNYFRIHPKGVGLVCKRQGGLPRLTFVEEYLGEIHEPWRWFELQDAVKKITGDELPDFYNILLERPKDDPNGYDVLFVDAAAKGAFASRMSHSCTPNCQAVVMACGGRLTIALYTLRQVHEGEELTFDYSSVTESEKEFREAICLCGTVMCRGSYLYFTGSRAFQQVMNAKHNMLHRQAILARAGTEPLTQEDLDRMKAHGLGDSALGSEEYGDRCPDWLLKWTALICEYLELEEACLKQELLDQPNSPYTEVTATAEAKGVISNRLQNIVITLDKVKMVLRNPEQSQDPPLRLLTDKEVVEHLWTDDKAVVKKLLRCVAAAMSTQTPIARSIMGAKDGGELQVALAAAREHLPNGGKRIVDACLEEVSTPEEARTKMHALVDLLREIDNANGGGLTAAADLIYLYASTKYWITSNKNYRGHTSPPVPINLKDLFLNRAQEELATKDTEAVNPVAAEAAAAAVAQQQEAAAANLARKHSKNPALRKTYRPAYVWGQLNGWFKQTVNDPTASLSAERRGTLSLPDIESAFSSKGTYGTKQRTEMVTHIERQPHGMWKTGTQWTFRNDSKVYGSPMLDAAWLEVMKREDENPLPTVIGALKSAVTPLGPMVAPPRAKRGGGGGRGGGGRGKGKRGKKGSAAAVDDYDSDDELMQYLFFDD